MKKLIMILVVALFVVFTLAGCSSGNNSALRSGVNDMLKLTSDIQNQLQAGNESKIKELGPQLEETWSKFEDGVKEKYPDLYGKVEDALDPTIAGTKAQPLDKDTLSSFNNQLTQALSELAEKVK